MALDLGLYDFSFIPIETLSIIYQQFLHAAEEGLESRGRKAGAYYTPLPLVNYVLSELESRRPLEEGMRVLDPSCGSGAFLVQCYRTLVEKRLKQGPLRPSELRELLTKHIFGVDRDGDACQVAEMSLILTLLDYTSPPDLEHSPTFKLPTLRDTNIFQADFFDPDSLWAEKRRDIKADWLVGNPPWLEAKRTTHDDQHARKWMEKNAGCYPTGGNQVAEAFVWHSLPLLGEGALAGVLLPAMTLFKMESARFRERLFQTVRPWCVANFANLAYVLFAGRSKTPTMALFYSPRKHPEQGVPQEERFLTFAPFLSNQRAGRAKIVSRRKDTWSVVVNGAEIRELTTASVSTGDFLPWKEAMWGSFRDTRLLKRVANRFPPLAEFAKEHGLQVHEGFQLRSAESGERVDPMPELAGRLQVNFSRLKRCGRIFSFPQETLSPIPAAKAYVRSRGGLKGLDVSEPPHIIVDASRRFAVYSDEFLAVPSRKIGVSGPQESTDLLKALSIYLSSSFCTYQQYFTTPEWGIRTSLATLSALLGLPTPFGKLTPAELQEWAQVQDDLVANHDGNAPPEKALRMIDELVCDILGLTHVERILIDDFIRWNMQMVQGKVPTKLVSPPPHGRRRSFLPDHAEKRTRRVRRI